MVNNSFQASIQWKPLGTINGLNSLSLPSNWNELMIETEIYISIISQYMHSVLNVNKLQITETDKRFDFGGGTIFITSMISQSKLQIIQAYYKDTDYSSTAKTVVYYR